MNLKGLVKSATQILNCIIYSLFSGAFRLICGLETECWWNMA